MPFFLVLGAAAAVHYFQRRLSDDKDKLLLPPVDPSELKGLTPIRLLPSEERFIDEHPIRVISFYEGNPSDAARILLDRLNDIVKANPWLSGCLVKGCTEQDAGVDNPPIRIWYDESAATFSPGMFQYLPRGLVHLCRTTPYAYLERILDAVDVSVKTNDDILNNTHASLFRVSIIPEHACTDALPDGFALVMSMSNALGDDFTFFKLYNMLIGSEIVSLEPTRMESLPDSMAELMGANEAEYLAHITDDPAWEKIFINDESIHSADLQGRLFEVSSKWINDSKIANLREGSNEVKTITTADIIVSWFWNSISRPAVGLLEVNLREHIKEAGPNHVGNYTNSIAFTSEDYKTPERIQQSRRTFCRVGRDFDPPTILPRVRVNTSLSIVTNHLPFCQKISTFDRNGEDNTLCCNDFKLICQMPLYLPITLKSILPKRMSFLDLFLISPERIGCFVCAPPDAISKIDECGIVHDTIFSF
jgi:hypothetical protein